MEENKNQAQTSQKKKSSPVTLLVFLAIIGVLIYALSSSGKNKENEDNKPKPPTVADQIELTEDNISYHWVREVDGKIFAVDFGPGDKFIYSCQIKDELELEFCSVGGSYVISDDSTVQVNYTLDDVEYTEKYYVAVSETKLVIGETEDGFKTVIGTYSTELDATEDGNAGESGNDDTTSSSGESANNGQTTNTTTNATEWKTIYKEYVDSKNAVSSRSAPTFALGYIDNDDIPELFVFDQYDGYQTVCTIKDGKINEVNLPYFFGETSYIEKSGTFKQELSYYDYEAEDADFFVTVYSLEKGNFEIIHFLEYDSGITGSSTTTDREYDLSDIGGLVNSWLDPLKAVKFNDVSYDEIIQRLS